MQTGSITRDPSRAVKMAGGMILLFMCLLAGVYQTLSPTIFNLAYPGIVLIVAGWLYISHPPLYLGFVWWIWFITPFVRRLADYQAGFFNPTNPVMLAPLLVTGLTAFTFLRFGKRLQQRMYFPFLLSMLGIGYGYLIGVIRVGALSATYGLLQWILPLLFGFHVMLFWRLYPNHRRVVRTTFTWGVLIMGIYAIVQYIVAPVWDMKWLVESGMTSSMGRPEPTQFRLFSTLNATGPFASIMMTGLLLLFANRGVVSRLAAAPGYISFLLSLVRSAWGGWFIGLLYTGARLTGQSRTRLVGLLVAGIVLCVPLFMFAPNTDRIVNRAETLTDLEDDGSLNARMKLYQSTTAASILNPVGNGIGGLGTAAKLSAGDVASFDSGVLEIPLTLGWPGTLFYLGGFVWMLWGIIQVRKEESDQFAVVATAIVLAFTTMMVFNNQLAGLKGCVVWSFMGLVLAAKRYYSEQRKRDEDEESPVLRRRAEYA